MRQIDPDGIKQIDFRAARERMKDLLTATPATQVAPRLIRLDEPLDDIPSIDEALDVLRSDGDLTPQFEAMEQSSETRKVPGETPLAESFAHQLGYDGGFAIVPPPFDEAAWSGFHCSENDAVTLSDLVTRWNGLTTKMLS